MPRPVRTIAEIERDLAADRAGLAASLDALGRHVSFEGVIDGAKAVFARNGAEITRTVAIVAKDNPLAVALTSAGIAWFLGGPLVRDRFGRKQAEPVSGQPDPDDMLSAMPPPSMPPPRRSIVAGNPGLIGAAGLAVAAFLAGRRATGPSQVRQRTTDGAAASQPPSRHSATTPVHATDAMPPHVRVRT